MMLQIPKLSLKNAMHKILNTFMQNHIGIFSLGVFPKHKNAQNNNSVIVSIIHYIKILQLRIFVTIRKNA